FEGSPGGFDVPVAVCNDCAAPYARVRHHAGAFVVGCREEPRKRRAESRRPDAQSDHAGAGYERAASGGAPESLRLFADQRWFGGGDTLRCGTRRRVRRETGEGDGGGTGLRLYGTRPESRYYDVSGSSLSREKGIRNGR